MIPQGCVAKASMGVLLTSPYLLPALQAYICLLIVKFCIFLKILNIIPELVGANC